MDIMQAMGAMQNPQGMLMQYAMQGMIAQHPAEWKQAQEMFTDKNKKQQLGVLRNLYRQKGMDLEAVARQWGIQL